MGWIKVQFHDTLALRLFFLNNGLGKGSYLIVGSIPVEAGETQLEGSQGEEMKGANTAKNQDKTLNVLSQKCPEATINTMQLLSCRGRKGIEMTLRIFHFYICCTTAITALDGERE